MKKLLFITTGTFALAGAMTGLGAFGGMAFASTPAPAAPTAIVQPAIATPATPVKPSSEKASVGESASSSKETDNVNYQEQGDHQSNNGVAETGSGTAEKKSAEETSSGPDTGNLNVQQ